MKNRWLTTAGAVATLGLAACSGSGTSPQTVTSAKLASDVLEMSVGTANIFGDMPGAGTTGLNVAVSYRQPSGALHPGDSAVLVNSPTLSLASALTIGANGSMPDASNATIALGPAPGETSSLTSTAQTAANLTTFGTSGGAFGLGLEPFNYTEGGVPFTTVPYAVPLFDALTGSDPNQFIPWGGPPAFDPNGDKLGTRDGQTFADGVIGVSEGLDVFQGVAPTIGSYGLSVGVPATTGTVTQTTTASITSSALLPAVAPAVPTLDASGGGTFTYTLPAGVTEAYIQVTDFGPDTSDATQPSGCNTASLAVPVYYTFEVTSSGTVTLADSTGPGTPAVPTPSICTAAQNAAATSTNTTPTTDPDDFSVQTIGFDYPAFEASYPNSSGKSSPTLAGSNGQSDITISSAAVYPIVADEGSKKRKIAARMKALALKRHR